MIPKKISTRFSHEPDVGVKHVDLKLVSRLEFRSGTVAMRYEPRRVAIRLVAR
jgi:hypothetical protein